MRCNPDFYKDQKVIIDGEFWGWNCSELGGPPVTRSDWCIRDWTGSIYVTGMPPALDFSEDLGKRVSVTGMVKITESGEIYIEASSVEP